MKRLAALLVATIPALLAPGCASLGPIDSPELARALRSRGIDPGSLVVPFEITDEMRAWAHRQVPDTTPAGTRLDQLLAAMVDPTRLKLEYILDGEPVISITISASSRIVNSFGLPRLIGPQKSSSVSMRRVKPSRRSST